MALIVFYFEFARQQLNNRRFPRRLRPSNRSSKPVVIDLQEALRRARIYSRSSRRLLNQRGYRARKPRASQGRATPNRECVESGVHVYNEQAVVRQNLFSLVRRGDYRRAQAAEAVALVS